MTELPPTPGAGSGPAMPGWPSPRSPQSLICSRRACGQPATRAVLWRNPRLHDEARRKVWLACDEHEEVLRSHLAMRGFPVRTVPVSEIPEGAG